MKKISVTVGTIFVSKFVATYYKNKGYEVYLLNRNTKKQVRGVHVIQSSRENIGDKLKNIEFDVVLDITTYNREPVIK